MRWLKYFFIQTICTAKLGLKFEFSPIRLDSIDSKKLGYMPIPSRE